jgi:hypothetical protein
MKRLLPLLFLLPLLLGQSSPDPHWQTSVPAPVCSTDTVTTTQIELKSNSDFEIHLDEDNDGDGYGSVYIYSGANDLEVEIDDTGNIEAAGTVTGNAVHSETVITQDGLTLGLDVDNTGAVATGVGIELAPNTSGTPITMKTTTGPDLDWAGATEYNYDAKINYPATRFVYFIGDRIHPDGTDCTDHGIAGVDLTSTAASAGGPRITPVYTCLLSASNGYLFGMHHMPTDWDVSGGGDLIFKAAIMNDAVSPSGLLRGVFNAQCIDLASGTGSASGSWTAYNQVITGFNTQYHIEPLNSTALDPDGTCAGDDLLIWRFVFCDNTGTPGDNCAAAGTVNPTNVHFLSFRMEYPTTGAE